MKRDLLIKLLSQGNMDDEIHFPAGEGIVTDRVELQPLKEATDMGNCRDFGLIPLEGAWAGQQWHLLGLPRRRNDTIPPEEGVFYWLRCGILVQVVAEGQLLLPQEPDKKWHRVSKSNWNQAGNCVKIPLATERKNLEDFDLVEESFDFGPRKEIGNEAIGLPSSQPTHDETGGLDGRAVPKPASPQ